MSNVIRFPRNIPRHFALPTFDRSMMIRTQRKSTGNETRVVIAGKKIKLSADFQKLSPLEKARALQNIADQISIVQTPET